ncbi:MAG TPA: hypothetical protein DDZ83_10740 [Nitrospinae bacterium]|nr:hypothetical protein [Nitrospinota bacterium]
MIAVLGINFRLFAITVKEGMTAGFVLITETLKFSFGPSFILMRIVWFRLWRSAICFPRYLSQAGFRHCSEASWVDVVTLNSVIAAAPERPGREMESKTAGPNRITLLANMRIFLQTSRSNLSDILNYNENWVLRNSFRLPLGPEGPSGAARRAIHQKFRRKGTDTSPPIPVRPQLAAASRFSYNHRRQLFVHSLPGGGIFCPMNNEGNAP